MVEMILTEQQLACLKAAVPLDSEESAALNRGQRFGSRLAGRELTAVNCTLVTAGRLLQVAERSCPDVVSEIRVAMEQARQEQTIASISEPAPADSASATLRLDTERLRKAVELLADYHPEDPEVLYHELWRALNAELGRRTVGDAWKPIVVDRRHLSGVPFRVKKLLLIR